MTRRTGTDMTPPVVAMTPADVPAVTAMAAGVYRRPWSAGLFEAELGRSDRYYRVARSPAGALLGYAGGMTVLDEAHITTVVVDPEHRGRLIGSRLVLAVMEAVVAAGSTAATLEVAAANVAAQRLYARFGFAPVGLRRGYYADDGEDAIIMWAHAIDDDTYRGGLNAERRRLISDEQGSDEVVSAC